MIIVVINRHLLWLYLYMQLSTIKNIWYDNMSNATNINYFTTFLQNVDVVNLIDFHLDPQLISLFHLLIITHHISSL